MSLQMSTIAQSIKEIDEALRAVRAPALPGHIQVDFAAKGADGNFSAPSASPKSVALFSTNHVTVAQPLPDLSPASRRPPRSPAPALPPPPPPDYHPARAPGLHGPGALTWQTHACEVERHFRIPARPLPPAQHLRENRAMKKYWHQRYQLFSLFDRGIALDRESFYSVTPEKIAARTARRFRDAGCRVIVDAFAGAAGNTIQFARICGGHTVAIEVVAERVDLARHNARVYGVEEAIDFVNANAYHVLPSLACADAVYLSPPWGGPLYLSGSYPLGGFRGIVALARKVTRNVAILVPKNISHKEAFEMFGPCEVEENFLQGRLKTITIYFGDLVKHLGVTRSED